MAPFVFLSQPEIGHHFFVVAAASQLHSSQKCKEESGWLDVWEMGSGQAVCLMNSDLELELLLERCNLKVVMKGVMMPGACAKQASHTCCLCGGIKLGR